jgi:hypothetical protein
MRQTHRAGEKVFVDFSGDIIEIVNPFTGGALPMKPFGAAMGASNYPYAEACPSEGLADWIKVHVNLFAFLGGAPKFVICDNLKAAVTNPRSLRSGHQSDLRQIAAHYSTAIRAARPRKRAGDEARTARSSTSVLIGVPSNWKSSRSLANGSLAMGELVLDRPRLLLVDLGAEQVADDALGLVLPLDGRRHDLV